MLKEEEGSFSDFIVKSTSLSSNIYIKLRVVS